MSLQISSFLFLTSIVVVIVASLLLYQGLIKTGSYFKCSERLLGLLAALAADFAEISSSFTAFHINQHDLGFGIILGSNIFNIAALLGLSAALTGALRINHQELLFNGSISLLATILCLLLILGYIQPWTALVVLATIMIPYFVLILSSPRALKHQKIPREAHAFFSKALKDKDIKENTPPTKSSLFLNLLLAVGSVFFIFVGCVVLIQTSVNLGQYWHLSKAITGILIIAIVTSLPNMLTTIPFAFRKREKAVISISINSNNLNILLGICLPAIFYSTGSISPRTTFSAFWLLGMTAATLCLGYYRGGLFRREGLAIIGFYIVFVSILTQLAR